jgi:hypothetical protein
MMIITRKAINRRAVLRGVGAALALPLLDSMCPALVAQQKTAAQAINRLGVVYVPNGIMMASWTPVTDGATFDLKPSLKPLELYRDRLLVLSGLSSKPPSDPNIDAGAVHPRASTRFLTDVPPPTKTSDTRAGTSMDQIAAKEVGRHTKLASLELGLESSESPGNCGSFNCAYSNTIAWRTPTTPLPMLHDPRAVFERMFGDGGSTDPSARLARMREDSSVLDVLVQKTSRLERELGPGDRLRLSEYLDAIRDIERGIQNAEQQNLRELPAIQYPSGIPDKFEDHLKLMYDLMALAYQADMTRIATIMIGREQSGRTYPEIGISDGHHQLSHHQGDPAKLAKLAKIDTYHITLFTHFLEKLRSTPDGDGSLLDHMMLIYGAGMSDGNTHDPLGLPILLLGGGCGQLQGGRHIRFKKDTPLANLHLALLDKLGVHIERIGDSSGRADQI